MSESIKGVMVRLDPKLVDRLDKFARLTKRSRNSSIAFLLDGGLEDDFPEQDDKEEASDNPGDDTTSSQTASDEIVELIRPVAEMLSTFLGQWINDFYPTYSKAKEEREQEKQAKNSDGSEELDQVEIEEPVSPPPPPETPEQARERRQAERKAIRSRKIW